MRLGKYDEAVYLCGDMHNKTHTHVPKLGQRVQITLTITCPFNKRNDLPRKAGTVPLQNTSQYTPNNRLHNLIYVQTIISHLIFTLQYSLTNPNSLGPALVQISESSGLIATVHTCETHKCGLPEIRAPCTIRTPHNSASELTH